MLEMLEMEIELLEIKVNSFPELTYLFYSIIAKISLFQKFNLV